VEDVHDYICSAIQQNDVSTNQDVRAIRGRRGQPPFKVLGTGLEPFLESWRERATPHKLFFQSRGQLVSLRQARRKIALVLGIPPAHRFAVVILIVFGLVVIALLIVAFSMSLSLSQGHTTRGQTNSQHDTEHPFCFHCLLRPEGKYSPD
jgi:hypothetical protein